MSIKLGAPADSVTTESICLATVGETRVIDVMIKSIASAGPPKRPEPVPGESNRGIPLAETAPLGLLKLKLPRGLP